MIFGKNNLIGFLRFFFFKKKGVCNIILFFENIFRKMAKIHHKKITTPNQKWLKWNNNTFVIPLCESNFSHLMGFVPSIYICYLLGNINGHGKVVFWDLVKSIAIMSFSKH